MLFNFNTTWYRENKKQLRYNKSKLISNINVNLYSYSNQDLYDVEFVLCKIIIYFPLSMIRHNILFYHFHIKHPGGGRFAKTYHQVLYPKPFLTQTELSVKMCNKLEYIEKKKSYCRHLTLNISVEKNCVTWYIYP